MQIGSYYDIRIASPKEAFWHPSFAPKSINSMLVIACDIKLIFFGNEVLLVLFKSCSRP